MPPTKLRAPTPPDAVAATPRVAVVSKAASAGGGASRIAELSAALFNERGAARATHFLRHADGPLHPWQRRVPAGPFEDAIDLTVRRAARSLGLVEALGTDRVYFSDEFRASFDVVHVHDAFDAISLRALGHLARHMPVVWTLHDCSAFTAGCISPMGCTRFTDGCGGCPQLAEWPFQTKVDRTRWLFDRKRPILERVTTLAPSRWMAAMAARSAMRTRPTEIVRNFVDLDTFRPRDRAACRAALGLPLDAHLVLVNALTFGNGRKGVSDAAEALGLLASRGRRVHPVLVGRRSIAFAAEHPELAPFPMGWIRDANHLALINSACDALLFPSHADNAPMAVAEAMACGLPVVAYDVDGVGELVDHERTGLLAPLRDVPALTAALGHLFATPALAASFSQAARAAAVERHAPDAFIAEHLRIYREAIARFRDAE